MCVHKGYGTAEDYATAEAGIMSSIARLANEQRKARFVIPNDDGTYTFTVASKKPKEPLLYNREHKDKKCGVAIVHVDEERNRNDLFVTTFLENPTISEDPLFKESLKYIKVCTTFEYVAFL